MRRLLIGTSISLGMVASAAAAPPYVAAYNWTGFYVGGNIGYSWGPSNTNETLNDPGPPGVTLLAVNPTLNLNGVIGGGQIGYNLQRGKWVFGIEADLQATGQSGSTSFVCPGGPAGPGSSANGTCSAGREFVSPGGPVTDTLSEKLTWLGTVRGRVGMTVTPTILGYVTGGLAVGGVSTTDTISGTIFPVTGPAPAVASFSGSTTHAGWTIGGGIEAALGGHWTGKIEYLYVDLGTVSGGPFVTPIVAPSGAFLTGSFSSHVTDNILRVGVNYRF